MQKLHKNQSFHIMNKKSCDANVQYEIDAAYFPYFPKFMPFILHQCF